jgi:DNA-binding response OmpR family regulator
MPRNRAKDRILVVEPQPAIAEPLVMALRQAGYETATVSTGADALALAPRLQPDLILVDRVPDSPRNELCTALRHRVEAAIVMLADSTAQADRDAARDGVDDYVVKPFGYAEAVVRVRAVLRRTRQEAGARAAIMRVGPLEIDTAARRVRLDGTTVRLSRKELDLLTRLARDAGRVVTRQHLLEDVWGGTPPSSTRTLDVHIGLLRRKLGDERAHPRLIHTVRGVGFRLADEEELSASVAA